MRAGRLRNRNDREPFSRVVNFQQRLQDVADDRLLVMSGDQDRDGRPSCILQVYVWGTLPAEESIQGEPISGGLYR
jgi:hypothetical protein